ncbi:MAG: molybdenum cofactor biosynthesis protein MoaE [Erythrobacter sp.]
MRKIRLLTALFDPAAELASLAASCRASGGIASFTGQVRSGGGIEALELSHYEPLTLPGMEQLGADAMARFALDGLVILHRSGLMHPGEPIVLVAAAAPHRRAAINAVDFAMDHLKSAAWFWKREQRSSPNGSEWHWIEPRSEDHADLARWAR